MTVFEKLLSRGERRFGRYFGIPKLMMILCIGMGVTYVADYLLAAYHISLSYYLMFDREAIFHGQIWRLVSFIFMPPSSSPVFLLISLMFYWYLGTSLQNTWGTFRFTVYYLCGILGAILAGLITGYATNTYLNLSLFLACAVLFPETEVNLIIIPVKMKWLALVYLLPAAFFAAISFPLDRVIFMTLALILLASFIFTYVADEMEIRFYSEASNPATYTPTAKWDATGGKILKDLEAMIRMLTKRGLRASDLVCSPDVADTIINDAAVQKLLDNRRIEIGNVEPELLPDGAAIVARLNVLGRIISVISYDLTYTDDEGNDKLYIPSGKCVLTAPGAGRTAYGAVSQVEQSDGEFHTYAGRRVPKYVSSAEGNSRTLTISSRPLMIPNNKNPFIVADVLTD